MGIDFAKENKDVRSLVKVMDELVAVRKIIHGDEKGIRISYRDVSAYIDTEITEETILLLKSEETRIRKKANALFVAIGIQINPEVKNETN